MKLSTEIQEFQQKLGLSFQDVSLLDQALTHASFQSSQRRNNERLEFLGDRVLGLVIAEAMMMQDPDAKEGILAPRFNALVRKETCAEIAREIRLGAVLKLGRSEQQSGGRRKEATLGNAMEALIGALYLDQGYDVARAFVLERWGMRITSVKYEDARDAKTLLQEWAQARSMDLPAYTVIARSGPDHAPLFTIEVGVGQHKASAEAKSKRHAEQAAASQLLEQLEIKR